jgi:hypothetical protein
MRGVYFSSCLAPPFIRWIWYTSCFIMNNIKNALLHSFVHVGCSAKNRVISCLNIRASLLKTQQREEVFTQKCCFKWLNTGMSCT